jgi:hypothetical protein
MSKYNGGVKAKSSAKRRRQRALDRLIDQRRYKVLIFDVLSNNKRNFPEDTPENRKIIDTVRKTYSTFNELRRVSGKPMVEVSDYLVMVGTDVDRVDREIETLKSRV